MKIESTSLNSSQKRERGEELKESNKIQKWDERTSIIAINNLKSEQKGVEKKLEEVKFEKADIKMLKNFPELMINILGFAEITPLTLDLISKNTFVKEMVYREYLEIFSNYININPPPGQDILNNKSISELKKLIELADQSKVTNEDKILLIFKSLETHVNENFKKRPEYDVYIGIRKISCLHSPSSLYTSCALVERMKNTNLREFFKFTYKEHIDILKDDTFIEELNNEKQLQKNAAKIRDWMKTNEKLQQILSLDLEKKGLIFLPPEIEYFQNLTKLAVLDNKIKFIPDEITKLTKLKSVSFSCNLLTSMPSEFKELTELYELDLYDNKLTSFPDVICNLSKLTILNLGKNEIKEIPPTIEKLINLKILHIFNTKLKKIPSEFGFLEKLEYLNVEGNGLKEFPSELVNLKNLKSIRFDKSLESFPKEMLKLPNLKKAVRLSLKRIISRNDTKKI